MTKYRKYDGNNVVMANGNVSKTDEENNINMKMKKKIIPSQPIMAKKMQ